MRSILSLKCFSILVGALALVCCQAPSVHADPIIYGSAFIGSTGPASLYTINPNTGAPTLVGPIGFARVGALDFDPTSGILYGEAGANSPQTLITINTATGAGTAVGGSGGTVFQDIAFRPSDGALFGYATGKFYSINKTTGAATSISSDPNGFPLGLATAFSSGGTLYNADNTDLRTIDPTTGTFTHVVNMTYPIASSRANGMKFDFSTGTLYASVTTGSLNYLATINIATGVATEIGVTQPGLDAVAINNAQAVVPEPSSVVLFAIGGAVAFRWRRMWRAGC